jgi:hypothetical protein
MRQVAVLLHQCGGAASNVLWANRGHNSSILFRKWFTLMPTLDELKSLPLTSLTRFRSAPCLPQDGSHVHVEHRSDKDELGHSLQLAARTLHFTIPPISTDRIWLSCGTSLSDPPPCHMQSHRRRLCNRHLPPRGQVGRGLVARAGGTTSKSTFFFEKVKVVVGRGGCRQRPRRSAVVSRHLFS